MAHKFIRSESKARLKKAVEAVEDRSAAEVMVVVRPWSGRYWHVDLAAGSALAFVTLLIVLYTDIDFTPLAVLLNLALAFVLGAFIMNALTPLRLMLATPGFVHRHVETLAQALFYRFGVDRTRDRSGILVFVSLLEKRCCVVPDVGVTSALDEPAWEKLAQSVEAAIARHGVGDEGVEHLAEAIEALAEPLETALPRREDDINELPDIMDDEA